MKKNLVFKMAILSVLTMVLLGGCKEKGIKTPVNEEVTLLIAAASSLEYSLNNELIPLFEKEYPGIIVEGTYDSSGKLQTQIEEGLEADIFMPASTRQMLSLQEKNLIDSGSVVELLENKIVLITSAENKDKLTKFEDILNADTVALGDPESVPIGQYAKEALTSIGIWEEIKAKTSFGTNVTEVLNWVAEGSADAGVVYSTDAATTDKVVVIGDAPQGSLREKVLYPVGIVNASTKKEAATKFVEFLKSDEAMLIFTKYGFIENP
jgi:molybdate transport system substrate-binding protein